MIAPDSLKKVITRWGPALIVLLMIFLLSSIPMRTYPIGTRHYELNWETLVRKLGHLLEYALLAMAFKRGLRIKGWYGFAIILFCVIAYAISDEFHQTFVMGRTLSVIDVTIDSVGGMLGIWCAIRLESIWGESK